MKKYVILFLLSIQGAFAQAQFEANASKTTVGLNEPFQVEFTMNFDGDNFEQPVFEGFRILQGPSQQISQSWINGRSSFQKSYSYYLLPTKKGVFAIRSTAVEYDGKIYRSNPLKITVVNAIPRQRDPNEIPNVSADSELHLVADISKTNPYLNEPITIVYKLYFSNNIGITNFAEASKPKYNNFWNQNIEIKQLVAESTTYNGEPYRSIVLKKVILYPQKSGKLNIEPFAMNIDVQLPTGRRDIFGEAEIVQGQKRVSAGARTISVKPLPETGKPVDFSGAVGQFDFKATASRTDVKNGENIDLNVVVSGNGNLKLFSLPKPVVPSALEMYDPVHKEKITTPLSGMTGSISDKYVIVPQFKGKYPIKPMQFTYFDPKSGTYKTIVSQEIMVNVLDGPEEITTNTKIASGSPKLDVVKKLEFKDNILKTKLSYIKKRDFLGSTKYFVLQLLPFLIVPFIILYRRRKEANNSDLGGNRLKMNNKLAKKYLSLAKKQIGNKEQFYIALEKAMHNFLKAKLKIETTEMSKINIEELLLSRNANPETVSEFINLTENCEIARYAPTTSVAIQQDYDKAVLIIADLEKQLKIKD
jgi:BatD DUF11 like domain